MKFIALLLFQLSVLLSFSQESYNSCNSALLLCPNTIETVNNYNANKTLCGGCEDDFNFCFIPTNSIWLKFTTNDVGGAIQISFSNPVFNLVPGKGNSYNAVAIEAVIPCNSTSYTLSGNCISNANNAQVINIPATLPNTTYFIVLSGDQSGGATSPAEFNIDVSISGPAINRPVPSIGTSTKANICENEYIAIYAGRTNCPDSGIFKWFINGIHTATTSPNDSTLYTSSLKNGDVIHIESSCFISCPVTITNTSLPISVVSVFADAGSDVTIKNSEVVQLNGITGINTTVNWSPSYALSNPTITSPIANPSQTTTYMMTVTDTISLCTATDYITITVDKGLFVPNTFSPNGDGENDTWVIQGIESYPDCWITIYNRWGQLVFQATGYNKDKAWNGDGNMGKLNEGVYFYEIQLRDADKQTLKGNITLIR